METRTIIGVVLAIVAGMSLLTCVYFYLTSRSRSSLMGGGSTISLRGASGDVRDRLQDDPSGKEYAKLKVETKRKNKKKAKITLDELFFHAGIFSEKEKRDYFRFRTVAPFVTTPILVGVIVWLGMGADFTVVGIVMGILLGLQLPKSMLQRKIAARQEDILYYLPLVIEQIAIGVSSSLDVGPCVQRVVMMADERDSHNVVTELMRLCEFYVKSGASLEHALTEVGKLSGSPELKHAFMALAQVARHGGEISRQLQELADSVSTQRETKIEAKIKKLELEATGPVALVFAGFLIILLIGFGLQLLTAF